METRRTSASGRSTPVVLTTPRPSSSFAPAPPNPYLQHYHPHFRGGGGGGGGRASPSPSLGHVPMRGGPSPLFDAAGGPPPPPHMRRYSHVPRTSRSTRSNPASREASRSPSPHEGVYRRASAFLPPTGGIGGGGGGGGGASMITQRSRNNSSSPLYIPDRSPDVDLR